MPGILFDSTPGVQGGKSANASAIFINRHDTHKIAVMGQGEVIIDFHLLPGVPCFPGNTVKTIQIKMPVIVKCSGTQTLVGKNVEFRSAELGNPPGKRLIQFSISDSICLRLENASPKVIPIFFHLDFLKCASRLSMA